MNIKTIPTAPEIRNWRQESFIPSGVCYESTGKAKEAEAEYLKIYNNYKGSYALMPKLIFSLGRLAEADKRYADAEKYYNQITDEYSGSNYSQYAQDRIILMHARGEL